MKTFILGKINLNNFLIAELYKGIERSVIHYEGKSFCAVTLLNLYDFDSCHISSVSLLVLFAFYV